MVMSRFEDPDGEQVNGLQGIDKKAPEYLSRMEGLCYGLQQGIGRPRTASTASF